jgi:hypothetical protein
LASKALGMDVCALDGVHSRDDGKEYILELNDSAIGLNARYEDEDLLHIRDLVLFRMTQVWPHAPRHTPHATRHTPHATRHTTAHAPHMHSYTTAHAPHARVDHATNKL